MMGRNGRRYRVKRHGNRASHKHSLQYGECGGGINDVRNVWRIYAVGCCVSHHLCALLLACSRLWHWRGLVVRPLLLKMSRRYGSCLALQRKLQSLCCICLGGGARHDPYRQNRRIFRDRLSCLSFAKQNLTACAAPITVEKMRLRKFSEQEDVAVCMTGESLAGTRVGLWCF